MTTSVKQTGNKPSHLWKPGQSGNPNGRPVSPKTELLKALEQKAVDVIEHALDNNDKTVAIFVYEQLYGKPKQAMDVSGKIEQELTISPELLATRLKELELMEKELFLAAGKDNNTIDGEFTSE